MWCILLWVLAIWGLHGILNLAVQQTSPNFLTLFHLLGPASLILLKFDKFWLRAIFGVGWILNGLFSLIVPFGFLMSFADPVASVGIKILAINVFTLSGIDQIAFYFLSRGFIFMLVGVGLMQVWPCQNNRPSIKLNPEPVASGQRR